MLLNLLLALCSMLKSESFNVHTTDLVANPGASLIAARRCDYNHAPADSPSSDNMRVRCVCFPTAMEDAMLTTLIFLVFVEIALVTIDSIIRVLIGPALIAWALNYIFPDTGWNWFGWIGIVPILTAAFATCSPSPNGIVPLQRR